MIERPQVLERESEENKIENVIIKIKEEISHIFKKCGINPNKKYSDAEKFSNAFKLFEYVVKKSSYDESIMSEKS